MQLLLGYIGLLNALLLAPVLLLMVSIYLFLSLLLLLSLDLIPAKFRRIYSIGTT